MATSYSLPVAFGHGTKINLIEKFNLNTANFGIAGTSLISYYAVFKEYVKQIKPENVILFYYEGNDFLMLNSEKNSFLSKYLKKDFTQNLIKKNYEVNKSLKILENYTQSRYNISMDQEFEKEKNLFNKERMIDFLEIQNLILFSFSDTLTSPFASSRTFLNSYIVFFGIIIPVISSAP